MDDILSILNQFTKAFSELRLDDMMKLFSNTATSFFPIAHHHLRLEGKLQIHQTFQNIIDKIKSAGLTGITLDIEDLRVQRFGDVAIASFHIRDNELNRRTLVLRKTGDWWFIEHLHASNAPMEGVN
jgi:ketosteroid isomerase-like protein